jgi:hypothetical protein
VVVSSVSSPVSVVRGIGSFNRGDHVVRHDLWFFSLISVSKILDHDNYQHSWGQITVVAEQKEMFGDTFYTGLALRDSL